MGFCHGRTKVIQQTDSVLVAATRTGFRPRIIDRHRDGFLDGLKMRITTHPLNRPMGAPRNRPAGCRDTCPANAAGIGEKRAASRTGCQGARNRVHAGFLPMFCGRRGSRVTRTEQRPPMRAAISRTGCPPRTRLSLPNSYWRATLPPSFDALILRRDLRMNLIPHRSRSHHECLASDHI